MKLPFIKLKGKLMGEGLDYISIGKRLGHSPAYISNCLNNKAELKLSDVYKLCDLAKINYCDIAEYFPVNGGV